MATAKNWVITTSGKRSLAEIKKEATEAGFKVADTLEAIGCITGSATMGVAQKLRTIQGVEDVSQEPPQINIGPPDAEIS